MGNCCVSMETQAQLHWQNMFRKVEHARITMFPADFRSIGSKSAATCGFFLRKSAGKGSTSRGEGHPPSQIRVSEPGTTRTSYPARLACATSFLRNIPG